VTEPRWFGATTPAVQLRALVWGPEDGPIAHYLHGADDGCATPDYAHWVRRILPEGSDTGIIDRAGHFLQLEQRDAVAGRILDFIGRARTSD
jgi:pimeloyl-ACP methyl ester carboxylesterase